MREWCDHTVARILALQPKRVLEIGCGKAFCSLVWRHIASAITESTSQRAALQHIAQYVSARGLSHVTLQQADAAGLSSLESGAFDLVIINSGAAVFPQC